MRDQERYERDNQTYKRLKETIRQTYPKGWFVAIADDQVVGAAATFQELEDILRGQNRVPRETYIVEAGVDYPEYVTIFLG